MLQKYILRQKKLPNAPIATDTTSTGSNSHDNRSQDQEERIYLAILMPRVKTSHTPCKLEFGRRWQRYICPEGMASGTSKVGHNLGVPVTNNGDDVRSTNGAANAPLCVDVIIEKLLERRDSQKQASLILGKPTQRGMASGMAYS